MDARIIKTRPAHVSAIRGNPRTDAQYALEVDGRVAARIRRVLGTWCVIWHDGESDHATAAAAKSYALANAARIVSKKG